MRSSFLVRIRNAGEEVHDKEAAWNALQICPEPEDPNFHQLAGLLAYGPLALGKGQHCPRDGLPDCSIVDALEATSCLDLVVFLHLEIGPNIDSANFFSDLLLGPVLFCPPNIDKAKWKGHVVPVVGLELQVLNSVGSVETMVGAA